jgi:cytoskeletal protein CcmA (bactofilin family)
MSACWLSRSVVVSLVALLGFVPSAADARRVRESTVTHSDGSITKRIDINGRIVSLTTSSRDSDSTGITIRGGFDGGPIVVHGSGNGIVRLFSDARVGSGERVDGDVVAVFGSVRIEGEVTGSAVAVFGSLDLRPGAIVHGDAVAVGGALRESEGSKVSGQTVNVGFLPLTLGLPGLPVVIASIALAWLVSLFFGWLAAALFPLRLARVAITSSRRTAASLALGIVSGPLLLMCTLLLMVTVIGIPIALFLPIAYVVVVYAGQIAATYVLGCKLTRRRLGEGGVTAPLVAGSLLVASIFVLGSVLWENESIIRMAALFCMLVGVLLMMGLSTIGTGAFLLSRAGTRPVDYLGRGSEWNPVPAAAPAPAADATGSSAVHEAPPAG